jgi:hypothetical protein
MSPLHSTHPHAPFRVLRLLLPCCRSSVVMSEVDQSSPMKRSRIWLYRCWKCSPRSVVFPPFPFDLPYQNQETLSNIVHVAYSLSKMPSSRQGLLDAGADRILLKISQTENPKLKANCSRSLKNLSSDATETIEEGAVAALIAMSLEVHLLVVIVPHSIPLHSSPGQSEQ